MGWIQLNRYKIKVYGKKGKFSIKGMPSDDVAFLHNLLTNDIKGLKYGQFNYNLRLTGSGEPVSDFFVYREDDFFILDTNLSPEAVIQEFSRLKLSLNVSFELLSYEHIFLFGKTAEIVTKSFPENFQFIRQDDIYVAKNPVRYGIDGIDLFGNLSEVKKILPEEEKLTEMQAEDLRIRNCIPKIGKELKKGFHPLEANILYAFSFEKGCYVGQEAIARVHFRGRPPRTLVLFESSTFLSEEEKVFENEKPVGVITSVTSDKKVGLGYILRNSFQEDKVLRAETDSVRIIKQCAEQF
ncbi:folate-binding protein YgfZ [Persephonella atlantica]|uniref:Folate-binding protein YgfZ n=1 Tax=Persephonella atlantica TaxID=2699429 RepID=A0ABS1GK61_9AQUI|nr:folate-binding protein YgfZ [Persephonella atlantica]MBK3333319.1 folate-binding protein YgfZ [Persephonella atlantica]